jgi:hypothetical protein
MKVIIDLDAQSLVLVLGALGTFIQICRKKSKKKV